MKKDISTIDEYIAGFPENVQKLLQQIRATIKKAAPTAEEKISYGIPTFYLHGNLVHFGGYKNHIGFYPAPSGIEAFEKRAGAIPGRKGYDTVSNRSTPPLTFNYPGGQIQGCQKFRKSADKKKKMTLKTCSKGHQFYKTSDCPTCPVCEEEQKPKQGFLSLLASPARRALENKGIKTLQQLSEFSEKEILSLHGMGKTSIPILQRALEKEHLSYRK